MDGLWSLNVVFEIANKYKYENLSDDFMLPLWLIEVLLVSFQIQGSFCRFPLAFTAASRIIELDDLSHLQGFVGTLLVLLSGQRLLSLRFGLWGSFGVFCVWGERLKEVL